MMVCPAFPFMPRFLPGAEDCPAAGPSAAAGASSDRSSFAVVCLTASHADHSSEGGFQDVGQIVQELGQVVQGEGCHG